MVNTTSATDAAAAGGGAGPARRAESHFRLARSMSAREPNRSCSSWAGVSTGHIHSNASTIGGRAPELVADVVGADRVPGRRRPGPRTPRCSTNLRAALWCRKRRWASRTMRSLAATVRVSVCAPMPIAQVGAQPTLAVGHRLADDVAHPGVALDPGHRGHVVATDGLAVDEVGEDGELDAGLAQRRAAPGRCSRGTGGWVRSPARPGRRAGTGGCRAGRRPGAAPPPSCPVPGPPWTTSTPESGERMISSCSPWMVATMSPSLPERAVSERVDERTVALDAVVVRPARCRRRRRARRRRTARPRG